MKNHEERKTGEDSFLSFPETMKAFPVIEAFTGSLDPQPDWSAMRRDRKYLPETMMGDREMAVEQLETILFARFSAAGHFVVEAMTDQIDVYVNGRKVAVYMP